MNFIFGFEVRISLTLEVGTAFTLLQSMSRLDLDRIFQKQIKRMILHHSCMLKVYCPEIDLPESLKSSKWKNYCQMMKYGCLISMPYGPYDMAPMISYDKQYIGHIIQAILPDLFVQWNYFQCSQTSSRWDVLLNRIAEENSPMM